MFRTLEEYVRKDRALGSFFFVLVASRKVNLRPPLPRSGPLRHPGSLPIVLQGPNYVTPKTVGE